MSKTSQEMNFAENSTAGHLYEMRDAVHKTWLQEIKKKIAAAKSERNPILTDTLPAFIVDMAKALSVNHARENATDSTTIAQEHGGERARVTKFSPEEVMEEYHILREVLIDKLSGLKSYTREDEKIIRRSCDKAMTESLTAYFLVLNGIKEQFAMALTHDLKSPLNMMRLSADLISLHPKNEEMVTSLSKRILTNVGRMDRMIQSVLDSNTVNSGESLDLVFSICNLNEIVTSTIEELSMIHGERFVLTGDQASGHWDCDSIKRAIENLCINAVKYGQDKGLITVNIENIHGRVILSVHNSGSYIPAEEQETIFRSFMRTTIARTSKAGGWGIGLSVVRGVAEGHGGSVAVVSSEEEGTTFLIDILQDPRGLVNPPRTPGT